MSNPISHFTKHTITYHCQDLSYKFNTISAGVLGISNLVKSYHDDVIKLNHFSSFWPFVRGSHPSPMNHPHKGQWHGALMFSLTCAWTNGWANHRDACDLRRHRANCDVTVMLFPEQYDLSTGIINCLIKCCLALDFRSAVLCFDLRIWKIYILVMLYLRSFIWKKEWCICHYIRILMYYVNLRLKLWKCTMYDL